MYWIAAISVVMFFASIGLVWLIIVLLPRDYLVSEHSVLKRRLGHMPVLRAVLVVAKNVLGLLFVLSGLVMLVTPGQGVMFVFLGLTMLDVPGKQEVINRILGNRKVIKAINRIRAYAHRPPLILPPAKK